MSNAASRNRKRDNARRIGTVQTKVQETWARVEVWFDTTPGQIALVGTAVALVFLSTLIVP